MKLERNLNLWYIPIVSLLKCKSLNEKSPINMRYPLLALLLLSAHVAHAQLFGRMGGSSESPAFHPQGLPVTTVAPAYISRDDKPSPVTGFEPVRPEPYLDLSSITPPVPVVNTSLPRVTPLPSSVRRPGVSVMSGFGYGFSQGYGFGSTSRLGYTFPFGLYLGFIGLLSLGTDFSSGVPTVGIINRPWLRNNILGTELGFEVPMNLFGGQFANRAYAGIGCLWSSLNSNATNTFEIPGLIPPVELNMNINSIFYTAGNVFYYRIPEFFILRNLLVGIDVRYVFANQRSGLLAVPMLGVYF